MRKLPPDVALVADAKTLQRVLFTTVLFVFALLLLSRVAGLAFAPLLFILLALVLTMGLNPLVAMLESRYRLPRQAGALLVVVGILALIVGFIAVVLPLFVGQFSRFAGTLPQLLEGYQNNLEALGRQFPLAEPLLRSLSQANPSAILGNGQLVNQVLSIATSLVGLLASALLLFTLVLFMLMSPEPIVKGALGLVPPRHRPLAEHTLVRIGSQLGMWLLATLFTSTVIGVLVGVGLWLVGFENALLFGMVAAFTNPIPFIGPWLGFMVPAAVAVANGEPQLALLAAAVVAVVQQIDNNLLSPVVMRRAVQLHPASLLMGVVVFATVLGPVGAFLTVPLAIIIKALYEEVYMALLDRPEVPEESVAQVVSVGHGAATEDSIERSQANSKADAEVAPAGKPQS